MLSFEVLQGLLLPFMGTALGAVGVYVLKDELNPLVQKGLTGFAAGVMVAASVWSLLIPSMEASGQLGQLAFLPAVIGFWAGTLFLLALDHFIPHLHLDSEEAEGPSCSLPKSTMLVLAVTLHNIPEGMAVGVVLAGWISGNADVTLGGALALSVGIAIQNFPEGAIISLPLRAAGMSRHQGFPGRHALRCGGTYRRAAHHTGGQLCRPCPSVSAGLCGRGHALCGGGRTYPRDVLRPPFQCGGAGLCLWIYADDGAGCGFGVKGTVYAVPF